MSKPTPKNPLTEPLVAQPLPPSGKRDVFFRLKLMPASIVQYSVEMVAIADNLVVERKVLTERDILPITLSKIEDALLKEIQR